MCSAWEANLEHKNSGMTKCLGKPLGILVGSLLNIEKNLDLITGTEKDFYEDQKGMRQCWLIKEIDYEFEQDRQVQIEQQSEEEQLRFQEESLINEEWVTSSVVLMNSSLNHWLFSWHYSVHWTIDNQHQPKIKKICDCTETIKSICMNVSMSCILSAQLSRVSI